MSKRSARAIVVLYSVTIGLSASLVFVLQPMFARFILPLAGGTPSVWAAAMVFFTTTLLLGYLYAHWSIQRLGARRQAVVHMAVAALPLVTLPVGLPDWDPPTGLDARVVGDRSARPGRGAALLRRDDHRAAAAALDRGHGSPRRG